MAQFTIPTLGLQGDPPLPPLPHTLRPQAPRDEAQPKNHSGDNIRVRINKERPKTNTRRLKPMVSSLMQESGSGSPGCVGQFLQVTRLQASADSQPPHPSGAATVLTIQSGCLSPSHHILIPANKTQSKGQRTQHSFLKVLSGSGTAYYCLPPTGYHRVT